MLQINHPYFEFKMYTYKMVRNAIKQLLVVDDDVDIRELLSSFLKDHQYNVDTAANAEETDAKLAKKLYDLIILDVMLPGEDGLSICRRIRSAVNTPIIMLTAMGDETDRIIGLEIGADDYLPKPFNPRELLARIKAVLRRFDPVAFGLVTSNPVTPNLVIKENNLSQPDLVYLFENWKLYPGKRELRSPENALISLTAGEYDLLLAFIEHPQRTLNRDQLLDITKGRSASAFDRSVDIQLSRLRRKIEVDHKSPIMIKTVRSGGYLFTPAVDKISGP